MTKGASGEREGEARALQFPLPMCNSFVSSSSVPLLQSVTVTVHGGVGTVLLLQNGAIRNRFEIEFGPLLPRCYAISLEFRSVRYGRCMYPVKAPLPHGKSPPTESLPTDRHLLTLEPSLALSRSVARSVSDSRSVCLSASRGVHFHFHSTNYVPRGGSRCRSIDRSCPQMDTRGRERERERELDWFSSWFERKREGRTEGSD